MRKFVLIFLNLFFVLLLSAQDTTIYVVSGKILDAETLLPVPNVLLLNTTKMYAAQSDTAGKFRILMMKGDKVRISCIGYFTDNWEPDFDQAAGKYIRTAIYVKPQTYQIGAVNIYDMRWKNFVYEMQNTEIEEDENQQKITKWINKVVADQDLASQNVSSGIRIMLPTYTHAERMMRKIDNQKKIDELNRLAEQKFNSEFVSKITGLQGDELTKFMKYCSFDRDFILKTSEYELILIVSDIYAEYKIKN